MMVQPNKTTVQATVVSKESDTETPGKFWVELVLIRLEEGEGPQFLSEGKLIRAFTFEEPKDLEKGTNVHGDIEVLGDAFRRSYQLSSVSPAGT